ncbi:hypothetical protein [Tenacibaculum sp. M341]|uniref:hypothetical protein n=1 Tax=Tenacibaculum sp. M341 TaxID=2530339 RepID=UPI00104F30CD|nr:hypothetical protein [Tenacibaculum sp. M341]TCI93596.1 hypothetical protein EYW44_04080 [Tenacibaculum sp. M341]
MINISFGGIKNTLSSISLISFKFEINKNKVEQYNNEFDWGKVELIAPISRFYEIPDFDVENSTMNPDLVIPFYNVVMKLIIDFDFTDGEFEYFKSNLGLKEARNKSELIEGVITKKDNITRNDSRYRLGFRSVYYILNNNLEDISYEYVWELNKILKPFFTSYKHKELFVTGLSLNENKC